MGVVNAEPCKADIYIRRFPTSDIPMESEQAMSDWLIKVYQEKVCCSCIVHAWECMFSVNTVVKYEIYTCTVSSKNKTSSSLCPPSSFFTSLINRCP